METKYSPIVYTENYIRVFLLLLSNSFPSSFVTSRAMASSRPTDSACTSYLWIALSIFCQLLSAVLFTALPTARPPTLGWLRVWFRCLLIEPSFCGWFRYLLTSLLMIPLEIPLLISLPIFWLIPPETGNATLDFAIDSSVDFTMLYTL